MAKDGKRGPTGSLWSVRLVGRSRELAELESERRAASQQLRVVLLPGDIGIGKTRLAVEFLARNRERVLALSARAHPLLGAVFPVMTSVLPAVV
ncbi:MAG: ATPase domain [Microbacteriaceae bacterium]|nr:ATPase domain [Microbacteriaceae bacterium]